MHRIPFLVLQLFCLNAFCLCQSESGCRVAALEHASASSLCIMLQYHSSRGRGRACFSLPAWFARPSLEEAIHMASDLAQIHGWPKSNVQAFVSLTGTTHRCLNSQGYTQAIGCLNGATHRSWSPKRAVLQAASPERERERQTNGGQRLLFGIR